MPSPPDRPPRPDHQGAPSAEVPAWLSGTVWRRIGYWGTAAWMLAILLATGGNTKHALFQYIFIVPLAAWVVGLTVGALARKPFARGGQSARE